MAQIVLFGATGFVGRNLAIAFSEHGHAVTAVSRSGAMVPGASAAVAMADLDSLPPLGDDPIVVHVAAQRYDAGQFEMAQSDILTANVDLSNRVYEFCARRGIKEVRMASSVAVYEAGLPLMDDAQPVDLNKSPHRNEAFYAWSKRWAEILADLYEERYGVSTVAFRLSNPYGPHDSTDPKAAHVLPAFVMRALGPGDVFGMKGDPYVERDFIWVGDVVDVFLKSLEWRGRSGRFNLCTGQTVTLHHLAETLVGLTGGSKTIEVETDFAPAAVRVRRSSADEVRQTFGIDRFTSLEDGLRPTVDWYREAMRQ